MNALILIFTASVFTALSNLYFRKNSISSSTPNGFLLLYYWIAFLFTILYDKDLLSGNLSYIMLFLGMCAGLLSAALMFFVSRALQEGSAGMTFAFQNASAIFPGLILFLLFGTEFGFSYSFYQLIGVSLVLLGLYLGAKKQTNSGTKASKKWLFYALACFFIQIFALTLIQGRCVLFNSAHSAFFSAYQQNPNDDIWFMPGYFGAAACIQTLIFKTEKRKLKLSEISYGSLGGLTNYISISLQLLATKLAMPFEQAILFPSFAVATIILCNFWANRLYKEDFNLTTSIICSAGIFIGMLHSIT